MSREPLLLRPTISSLAELYKLKRDPGMAHKALELEPRIGAMLPCNVIVRSIGEGAVEVSAIDPQMSMLAVGNDQLKNVAGQVRQLLETAVARI